MPAKIIPAVERGLEGAQLERALRALSSERRTPLRVSEASGLLGVDPISALSRWFHPGALYRTADPATGELARRPLAVDLYHGGRHADFTRSVRELLGRFETLKSRSGQDLALDPLGLSLLESFADELEQYRQMHKVREGFMPLQPPGSLRALTPDELVEFSSSLARRTPAQGANPNFLLGDIAQLEESLGTRVASMRDSDLVEVLESYDSNRDLANYARRRLGAPDDFDLGDDVPRNALSPRGPWWQNRFLYSRPQSRPWELRARAGEFLRGTPSPADLPEKFFFRTLDEEDWARSKSPEPIAPPALPDSPPLPTSDRIAEQALLSEARSGRLDQYRSRRTDFDPRPADLGARFQGVPIETVEAFERELERLGMPRELGPTLMPAEMARRRVEIQNLPYAGSAPPDPEDSLRLAMPKDDLGVLRGRRDAHRGETRREEYRESTPSRRAPRREAVPPQPTEAQRDYRDALLAKLKAKGGTQGRDLKDEFEDWMSRRGQLTGQPVPRPGTRDYAAWAITFLKQQVRGASREGDRVGPVSLREIEGSELDRLVEALRQDREGRRLPRGKAPPDEEIVKRSLARRLQEQARVRGGEGFPRIGVPEGKEGATGFRVLAEKIRDAKRPETLRKIYDELQWQTSPTRNRISSTDAFRLESLLQNRADSLGISLASPRIPDERISFSGSRSEAEPRRTRRGELTARKLASGTRKFSMLTPEAERSLAEAMLLAMKKSPTGSKIRGFVSRMGEKNQLAMAAQVLVESLMRRRK